jgi:hypothetical protein
MKSTIVDAGSAGRNNCFFLSLFVSFACYVASEERDAEYFSNVARFLERCKELGGEAAEQFIWRALRAARHREAHWPPRAGSAMEEQAADYLRDIFVQFLLRHRDARIGPPGMSQKEVLQAISVSESIGGEDGIRDVARRGTMVEGLVSLVPFVLMIPIRIDHYRDRHMQHLEFTCDFFRNCDYSPVRACAHLAFHGNHYMAVCHPRGRTPSFEPPRIALYTRHKISTLTHPPPHSSSNAN